MELPTEMTPGEPLYFLVSFKRRFADGLVIFWGPNAAGYTPDIKGAGAYTADEAAKHEDAETVAVPTQWVHENCRIRMVIDQGDAHLLCSPCGGTGKILDGEECQFCMGGTLLSGERAHIASVNCWCKPYQDEECPDVWVHNELPSGHA